WVIGPNPIPVDYVTRSGYIWKNGEQYRFDASVSNAPLWWVTVAVGALGFNGNEAFPDGVSSNSLFCTFSPYFVPGEPFTAQFRVTPVSGVAAYAIQDQIPAGWTVSSMNY